MIDPVSRVEGHGKVTLLLDENNKSDESSSRESKSYWATRWLKTYRFQRQNFRADDLCLSCATHVVGKMPLQLKLLNVKGELIDKLVKHDTGEIERVYINRFLVMAI